MYQNLEIYNIVYMSLVLFYYNFLFSVQIQKKSQLICGQIDFPTNHFSIVYILGKSSRTRHGLFK